MKEFKNGIWTPSEPVNGDIVRIYDSFGGVTEKAWESKVELNKIVITSHNDRAVVAVNESLTIQAEIRDANNFVIEDFNDSFVLPVGRLGGENYTSALMTFANGICSRKIEFQKAGEYEVTEGMINLHLNDSEKLEFKDFKISVYE